jgi:hypothetical protein
VASKRDWIAWFRLCQDAVAGKEPQDYTWARWSYRLSLHPRDAKFIARAHDDQPEHLKSLDEILRGGVDFIQVAPSLNYHRFPEFYSAFAFTPTLSSVATLDGLFEWLNGIIHSGVVRFRVDQISVPIGRTGADFLFIGGDRKIKEERRESVIRVIRK